MAGQLRAPSARTECFYRALQGSSTEAGAIGPYRVATGSSPIRITLRRCIPEVCLTAFAGVSLKCPVAYAVAEFCLAEFKAVRQTFGHAPSYAGTFVLSPPLNKR
jgi:hypothetical protein